MTGHSHKAYQDGYTAGERMGRTAVLGKEVSENELQNVIYEGMRSSQHEILSKFLLERYRITKR